MHSLKARNPSAVELRRHSCLKSSLSAYTKLIVVRFKDLDKFDGVTETTKYNGRQTMKIVLQILILILN